MTNYKIIVLFVFFLSSSLRANVVEYGVGYDNSKWNTTSSLIKCTLSHEIPRYGVIEFYQEAGEREQASLKIMHERSVKFDRGEIEFASPKWHTPKKNKNGWKFQFGEADMPVEFSTRQARTILDNLEQGLQPTIIHRENNNRTDLIQARLSPIMFAPNYMEFSNCQRMMIPVSFDEVKKSDVYFETGSVRLDEEALKWLSYVLEYSKDPHTRRLELSGYTDSIGSFRANHKLASARVETVQDHLVKNGIDPKIIVLKVYGEQRAVYDNTTQRGRTKNRRVEVKIYR